MPKAFACGCRSKGRKDPGRCSIRASCRARSAAGGAAGVNPADYDLVGLAMQEPQYRSPGVRELLDAVAKSRVPCMSIMNMPPLPLYAAYPGLECRSLGSRPIPIRASGTISNRPS